MPELRDEKLDFWIKNGLNVLLIGPHGVGKCLGRGTPVLMYNGTVQPVERVKENDLLMGPDSKPRLVTGVTNGREQMVKIVPTKGEPFTCNTSHILSLKLTTDFKKDQIVDISVKDFLLTNKTFQRRAMLFRAGVEFNVEPILPQPPYLLGLWLGDGTTASAIFTAADIDIFDIVDYLCDYANEAGPQVSAIDYSLSSGKGLPRAGRNIFLAFLQKYNLLNNKRIPLEYLTAPRTARLELLAGLIDTDGELSNKCYVITQKLQNLTDNILFLARSLGFAAYVSPCQKACVYKGERKIGDYYRITISGNVSEIPCLLSRKTSETRVQTKDVLKTSIKHIEGLGEGDYYGFTLDGDGRFLLGDFTVTHNTTRVLEAFERNKLRYKYFSAATMDPWVDFVGIPREAKDEKGSYLELILPKDLRDDAIDALFFDEFNRSHKKVRNAVMQLIQMHSINDRKFTNLKMVWAAINPEDEEKYQVEPLDPAQKGRFEIKFYVPSEPSRAYFAEKYTPAVASAAISWWKELPKEIQKEVDPRSIDQALKVHHLGGDMKDVLPRQCNVSQLVQTLRTGPIADKLKSLFQAKDNDEARKFLAIENNYASALPHLGDHKEWYGFFLPVLPSEKLSALMATDEKISNFVLAFCANHPDQSQPYRRVVQEILQAGINRKLVKKIKKILGANQLLASQFGYMSNVNATPPYFNKLSKVKNWSVELQQYASWPMQQTPHRIGIYQAIVHNIPEQLTPQEAVDTLGLLSTVTGRSWSKTVHNMPKLMGVVNHCIHQIHKKTALTWPEILTNYGSAFDRLLVKIHEAKLQDKLFCPNKGIVLTPAPGNTTLTLSDVVLQVVKHHGTLTLKEITEEVERLVRTVPAAISQAVSGLFHSGKLTEEGSDGRYKYSD